MNLSSNHLKKAVIMDKQTSKRAFYYWGGGQMAFSAIKRISKLKAFSREEEANALIKEWDI